MLMITALSSRVPVGVSEEMNRWLPGHGAELLDHADNLGAEERLTRRPDFRLVRVMELGEDEVDGIILRRIFENYSQPVDLRLNPVGGIGIEGDDPDILVVVVMPVLLVACGAVGGQLHVIEIILRIRLMISQGRNQRNMSIEQFCLGKEMVLPV